MATELTAYRKEVTEAGTARGLVLADNGTAICSTNAGLTTVTIPLESSEAFTQFATEIEVCAYGAAGVALVPSGGVTINGAASTLNISQFDGVTLRKIGSDQWVAHGVGSGGGGPVAAADVSYDNSGTNLSATDVQAAITELDTDLAALTAADIAYDPTGTNLSATDVQAAITELDTDLTAAINDSDVMRLATAAQINGLTVKALPVAADEFLLDDSADANNKKKMTHAAIFTPTGAVMTVGPDSAHNLELQTSGTTRATVNGDGEVGVGGTPTANVTLQIHPTTTTNPTCRVTFTNSASSGQYQIVGNGSQNLILGVRGTSAGGSGFTNGPNKCFITVAGGQFDIGTSGATNFNLYANNAIAAAFAGSNSHLNMVKNLFFAAGTATAPSLAMIGYQTSGFYEEGANIIGVATNGSKCAVFDASNRFINESGVGAFGVTPPTSQPVKINDPSGGATIDAESRTAIDAIIDVLEGAGFAANA